MPLLQMHQNDIKINIVNMWYVIYIHFNVPVYLPLR